jgi:hypothetical protein
LKTGRHIAITLPPNSPTDVTAYGDWKRFSKNHRLPVRFDAGLQDDFATLTATADYFLTTSITEGFGFSFLEPWTAEKTLRGRKLPEICNDFETRGIVMENMYTRLQVPTAWFDLGDYIDTWKKTVKHVCRRFAYTLHGRDLVEAGARLSRSSEVDFGLLNERFQKQVLGHLLKNPSGKTVLKDLNPHLEDLSTSPDSKNRIQKNRQIVLADYHIDAYRNTLVNIYARVMKTPVFHGVRKEVLLSRFLDLDRLSLLKWGAYES